MGGCEAWHAKMAATPATAATAIRCSHCVRSPSCTPTDVSNGAAPLRHTCAKRVGRQRIESAAGVQSSKAHPLHTQDNLTRAKMARKWKLLHVPWHMQTLGGIRDGKLVPHCSGHCPEIRQCPQQRRYFNMGGSGADLHLRGYSWGLHLENAPGGASRASTPVRPP